MSDAQGTPVPYATDASPVIPPQQANWSEKGTPSEPPKAKKGWSGCLIGCLCVFLLGVVMCGAGTWYAFKKLPDFARNTAVTAIEQSDLSDEDKRVVVEQVDRVVNEYKAGNISLEQVGEVFEEFAQSPLMNVLLAKAAMEKYVSPSGLSDEEKTEAKMTLERAARGVFEKKISQGELETTLDMISTKTGNQRQFANSLSDDELRKFLAECKRLADAAEIPEEPYEVDVGGEVKKAVDRALNVRAEAEQ